MSDFTIPIRVTGEEELYSVLDPSGLSFSSDFTDYLRDYVEDRKPREKVCLNLQVSEELDQDRFKKAYLGFIEKLQLRKKREIRKSNMNALRLLLIGIIFVIIGVAFAAKFNDVVAAIVSTIGSFSVWEASAIWIETLPELNREKRVLKMLSEAEIRYVREGEGNNAESADETI